jgi:hypothetical protein
MRTWGSCADIPTRQGCGAEIALDSVTVESYDGSKMSKMEHHGKQRRYNVTIGKLVRNFVRTLTSLRGGVYFGRPWQHIRGWGLSHSAWHLSLERVLSWIWLLKVDSLAQRIEDTWRNRVRFTAPFRSLHEHPLAKRVYPNEGKIKVWALTTFGVESTKT